VKRPSAREALEREARRDTELLTLQDKARPVLYQWTNGNRLSLLPVTEALWKLVRKLRWGCRPSLLAGLREWSLVTQGEALYVALHWTGTTPLCRAGSTYSRYVRGVELLRVHVGDGWWLGAHVAEPRRNLFVMTPPIGTLAMLRPPAMSKRWALEVKGYDTKAAKAWVTGCA
jgi:hypothetical protein